MATYSVSQVKAPESIGPEMLNKSSRLSPHNRQPPQSASHSPTSHYKNREARGILQLPGCAASLDKWSTSPGKLHRQCYSEKEGGSSARASSPRVKGFRAVFLFFFPSGVYQEALAETIAGTTDFRVHFYATCVQTFLAF